MKRRITSKSATHMSKHKELEELEEEGEDAGLQEVRKKRSKK